MKEPYWKTTSLDQMSKRQWEALCDGCGQCCLLKFEDEDDGTIYVTKLACKLLNVGSCQCGDYENRQSMVPDCIAITPQKIKELPWLPETCGYRLISEGKDLAWWHPLISGDPETVHQAGVSVRGFAKSERHVAEQDYTDYIIGSAPLK